MLRKEMSSRSETCTAAQKFIKSLAAESFEITKDNFFKVEGVPAAMKETRDIFSIEKLRA